MATSKQPNPTTLRIPEEWEPEIEAARAGKEERDGKPVSKHAWLLKAIRRVLDGEKNRAKTKATRCGKDPVK